MTTDIDVTAVDDLFVPNSIIELPVTSETVSGLSGIRFERHASANESRSAVRRRCFDLALEQTSVVWPQFALWLFACHSTWQPKSGRSLYLRLWKSLETANVILPTGSRVTEVQLEAPEGVRFFGLLHVPTKEAERAYNVLDIEPRSFVVGSTTEHAPALDGLLLQAWQRQRPELAWWAELASAVCGGGCLLFRPFGVFDDVEVGVDVILETGSLRQWSTIMGKPRQELVREPR